MFSIIVAVLFVIKIYSNSVHSLPKYMYIKTRNHRKITVQKLSKNAKNNLLKTKKVLNTEI